MAEGKSTTKLAFEVALATISLFSNNAVKAETKAQLKLRKLQGKMIRRAIRDYKKMFKLMKKDGFTEEETALLKQVLAAIAKAEITLLSEGL